mmetsp:Transcript_19087/g.44617  ORF Transcript_19087/g.44617 Transcript_19087/m.44617 type:complete len:352 (+) Transcript_19087:781-1836(+)
MLISALLGLLSLCGINVRLLLGLLLGALQFPQGIAGVSAVVLGEGLVIHFNGVVELLLKLIDASLTAVNLAHLFKRCTTGVGRIDLVPTLQQIVAELEHLVKVLATHLNPNGAFVVIVSQIVGFFFNSLVVHLDCLCELLLLVELVALAFELIRLLLFRSAVVLRWRLFLLLLLGSWSLGGWSWLILLKVELTSWAGGLHVNTLRSHDDLQNAWVLLHHLHHQGLLHLLVLATHAEDHVHLLHEALILHVLLNFGILCCGCGQLGWVHGEEAAASATTASGACPCTWQVVLCIHSFFQSFLEGGILGGDFQTLLVGLASIIVLLEEEFCQTFSRVAFDPIWLQTHTLCAIS